MAIRAELIQYAGNVVRVYNKPERTVNRIMWNDTVYVPERTCRMETGYSGYDSLVCSECGEYTTVYHKGKYCPGCGAKVVS